MCYSNVRWHQTCKVLLHMSAGLSEAHHTVTLLSSKEKKHPLTLKKQATELQSTSSSKILKLYHHIKEILINIETCSWANTFSSSSTHTSVTHVEIQGQNQMLSCWDSRSDINFNSFIFAGKIKSKSSKVELPRCLYIKRTPATLHPTTGWTNWANAVPNSKATLSSNQAMTVRRFTGEHFQAWQNILPYQQDGWTSCTQQHFWHASCISSSPSENLMQIMPQ